MIELVRGSEYLLMQISLPCGCALVVDLAAEMEPEVVWT